MKSEVARNLLQEYVQNPSCENNEMFIEAVCCGIEALQIVESIPSLLNNMRNFKSAWEDESFRDRTLAEGKIKSWTQAISLTENLLSADNVHLDFSTDNVSNKSELST